MILGRFPSGLAIEYRIADMREDEQFARQLAETDPIERGYPVHCALRNDPQAVRAKSRPPVHQ